MSRIQQEDVVADDAWLAGAEEYKKRFAACPEAIVETHILAERLTFTGPQFGCVLPPWNDGNATNPEELLREKTYEGAFRR